MSPSTATASASERGAFVKLLELLGDLQRKPEHDRDGVGEAGMVQVGPGPQLEGLGRGGQQLLGLRLNRSKQGDLGQPGAVETGAAGDPHRTLGGTFEPRRAV
jgi:hypothetical protein